MVVKRRIAVDDVFFALSQSGVARVWQRLLEEIVKGKLMEQIDADLVIVNRSDKLLDLGLTHIDFPDYDLWQTAQDRALLSRVMHDYHIDLFSSSYFTFCPSIPSLLIVYDMIPEIMRFDLESRFWLERKLAILQASRYVAISESTKKNLLQYYPFIAEELVTAAPLAAEIDVFFPRPIDQVDAFLGRHHLANDYWVMVGSRYQHGGYKNGDLMLAALDSEEFPAWDIVFGGGEPLTERERETAVRKGVRLIRLALDDDELAVCLSGSRALVYPSKHEGFGLPPLEALACGVPVVTTLNASLPEAVGDLTMPIGGDSSDELAQQAARCASPVVRARFLAEGPRWAATFGWDVLANAFVEAAYLQLNSPKDERRLAVDNALTEYTNAARRMQI